MQSYIQYDDVDKGPDRSSQTRCWFRPGPESMTPCHFDHLMKPAIDIRDSILIFGSGMHGSVRTTAYLPMFADRNPMGTVPVVLCYT